MSWVRCTVFITCKQTGITHSYSGSGFSKQEAYENATLDTVVTENLNWVKKRVQPCGDAADASEEVKYEYEQGSTESPQPVRGAYKPNWRIRWATQDQYFYYLQKLAAHTEWVCKNDGVMVPSWWDGIKASADKEAQQNGQEIGGQFWLERIAAHGDWYLRYWNGRIDQWYNIRNSAVAEVEKRFHVKALADWQVIWAKHEEELYYLQKLAAHTEWVCKNDVVMVPSWWDDIKASADKEAQQNGQEIGGQFWLERIAAHAQWYLGEHHKKWVQLANIRNSAVIETTRKYTTGPIVPFG